MQKTNAMRLLDKEKINYTPLEYPVDESDLSGAHVAALLNVSPRKVFKTLVLKGVKSGYFVCCVPCDAELDLKKAALAANEKKAEMIAVKDIQLVTGYIRGGCSPLGMKKKYPTYLDSSAKNHDTIIVSAGLRGAQIELEPDALARAAGAAFFELTDAEEGKR